MYMYVELEIVLIVLEIGVLVFKIGVFVVDNFYFMCE